MSYVKVYKYKKQISLDNGVTWQDVTPEEYAPSGDPIGYYDTYEECMAQYRTIQSGTTCVGVDKHNQDVYEVSYDNGETWEVVSASAGTLIETNSYDCGYRTRTTSGTAYCTGYDKYVDVYSQVSTDYGSTWTTTATTPTLIEADSPDCGALYKRQYLTFVASQNGVTPSFSATNDNVLYYSLNSGSTWVSYTSGETPVLNSGDKIMFKGSCVPTSIGIGQFGVSGGTFTLEGNPMSLLFGDNFSGQTSLENYDNAFYNLFSYYSTGLTSIDNLVLPATTLSSGCYNGMFNGCSSLTTVPKNLLPAATATNRCYQNMFRSCSSLTTTPDLPATTLDYRCYAYMFQDCTSLTTAPELPATTLADRCYEQMFKGCTSLTKAPTLSAATLTERCYYSMFNGCTSLNEIRCYATDVSATNCTYNWVYNVASSGNFYKNSGMTAWSTGYGVYNGIPYNWTVNNVNI